VNSKVATIYKHMELFNSSINTYDEIEDDKYTNEEDHNLVANPSCLQKI
jgi:hypothetical protein